MKKVIITTGGTGGHIYPAISLARKLEEKDIEVAFVGTKYRMENEIIPKEGFKFFGLPIKSLRKPSGILKFISSTIKAWDILGKEKPDAVIGFGNYISVPVLLAAIIKNRKIYLHEQNMKMGLANKLFYRFSKKTFLSFEKTFDNLPIKFHDKLIVTGNPIREEFYKVNRKEEREKLKIDEDEKMLLIIGGSLGAKSINDAIFKNWERFFEEKKIRVYWATGKKNFNEINEKMKKMKQNDVIKPYFENVPSLMAASDLVVCRAGASTISEIIEMKKPSILVPYDFVGQWENAEVLEEKGGALVYSNEDLDAAIESLFQLIKDDKKLREMANRIKKLKKGNVNNLIIEELDIWRN